MKMCHLEGRCQRPRLERWQCRAWGCWGQGTELSPIS